MAQFYLPCRTPVAIRGNADVARASRFFSDWTRNGHFMIATRATRIVRRVQTLERSTSSSEEESCPVVEAAPTTSALGPPPLCFALAQRLSAPQMVKVSVGYMCVVNSARIGLRGSRGAGILIGCHYFVAALACCTRRSDRIGHPDGGRSQRRRRRGRSNADRVVRRRRPRR
jgi:hypothetical protein